jgi:hypothetical protein
LTWFVPVQLDSGYTVTDASILLLQVFLSLFLSLLVNSRNGAILA